MSIEVGDAIKGIELTEEGKHPIKRIDFVNSEERINALHDPVRIQILQMLREGIDDSVTKEESDSDRLVVTITKTIVKRHALSVTELVQLSSEEDQYEKITKNQLYHHLPILLDHGFVIEYGTITTGKRTTKYYRRAAENFVTFGLHYGPEKYKKAVRKEIEGVLPVFRVDRSREEKKELLDLLVNTEAMRLKWARVIENLVQGDVTDPKAIELFEMFLWIYATGQNEFREMLDRLRDALF